MKKTIKTSYAPPALEVVELKTQGIICVSGNVNASMDGVFTEETITLP